MPGSKGRELPVPFLHLKSVLQACTASIVELGGACATPMLSSAQVMFGQRFPHMPPLSAALALTTAAESSKMFGNTVAFSASHSREGMNACEVRLSLDGETAVPGRYRGPRGVV